MTPTWETAAVPPPFEDNDVHIFSADLAFGRRGRFEAILSADELARAKRFRAQAHGDRFITARGMLRLLLGQYLSCAPEAVVFDYGQHGKPAARGSSATPAPHFNVSHTAGLGLFAFTDAESLGIDIEQIRPMADWATIAERFFSPSKTAALRLIRPDQLLKAFFRCWTAKEAFVKAQGAGFSHALDRFEVAVRPEAASTLISIEGDTARASTWTIADCTPSDGYVATLAIACMGVRLRRYRFELPVQVPDV